MPLFNYQCQNEECGFVVEKFLHRKDDEAEIVCPECGKEEFEKVMGRVHSRTWLSAKDRLHKEILPDADRIYDGICNGNDNDFLNISGD